MTLNDVLVFLDNEKYRMRGSEMSQLDIQKYFGFLDNESSLWAFSVKPVKALSAQENHRYFSFLDNSTEMAKYVKPADVIIEPARVSAPAAKHPSKPVVVDSKHVSVRSNTVLDVYMKMAEESFAELYNKDDGLKFRIYLQKLIPLKEDVILSWGDAEMSKHSISATEVGKVVQSYTDLRALDVLTKLTNDIREEPSFWKKITGYETQLTKAELYMSSIKERISTILEQAQRKLEDTQKNADKLQLLSHCLTVVADCASGENQNGGMYEYLYRRRDIVANAMISSIYLPRNLEDVIKGSKEALLMIDQTMFTTIPNLRLARANNV